MNSGNHEKSPNMGRLPCPAPLANPYVPFQLEDPPTYSQGKALIRGTLYPGLDLPFMGMVNRCEKRQSPMVQLQQLRFALTELGLYLNTHREDRKALDAYRKMQREFHDAREEYVKCHGPIDHATPEESDRFTWIFDPWPWEYAVNREG